jgi:hypothetical protein
MVRTRSGFDFAQRQDPRPRDPAGLRAPPEIIRLPLFGLGRGGHLRGLPNDEDYGPRPLPPFMRFAKESEIRRTCACIRRHAYLALSVFINEHARGVEGSWDETEGCFALYLRERAETNFVGRPDFFLYSHRTARSNYVNRLRSLCTAIQESPVQTSAHDYNRPPPSIVAHLAFAMENPTEMGGVQETRLMQHALLALAALVKLEAKAAQDERRVLSQVMAAFATLDVEVPPEVLPTSVSSDEDSSDGQEVLLPITSGPGGR